MTEEKCFTGALFDHYLEDEVQSLHLVFMKCYEILTKKIETVSMDYPSLYSSLETFKPHPSQPLMSINFIGFLQV